MRKLTAFIHVSLDGYFQDADGDMSWAHTGKDDAEWNEFVSENASGGGELIFGRITYEMMAGYWPTPIAAKNSPEVAEGMNNRAKTVFSRTLAAASWNSTKLVKGDLVSEVRKMKNEAGQNMTILGSGSIVSQLTAAELIDEFQLVINPILLGRGRTPFEGNMRKLRVKLISSRTFGNGSVLLSYSPAA